MHKVLTPFLLMLFLLACSDQELSQQDMLNTQTTMLKGLCEKKPSCLIKIDTLAQSCQRSHANNKDFNALNEREQIREIGDFGVCIIQQMDQGFQDRFDQAFPITETGVEITRPTVSSNSKGLLVRIMPKNIRITEKSKQNKDMPLKDLKIFIEEQNLAGSYSSVLLFVDDDADTGDMIVVMDIFKNAGIEKIHVAARK